MGGFFWSFEGILGGKTLRIPREFCGKNARNSMGNRPGILGIPWESSGKGILGILGEFCGEKILEIPQKFCGNLAGKKSPEFCGKNSRNSEGEIPGIPEVKKLWNFNRKIKWNPDGILGIPGEKSWKFGGNSVGKIPGTPWEFCGNPARKNSRNSVGILC